MNNNSIPVKCASTKTALCNLAYINLACINVACSNRFNICLLITGAEQFFVIVIATKELSINPFFFVFFPKKRSHQGREKL